MTSRQPRLQLFGVSALVCAVLLVGGFSSCRKDGTSNRPRLKIAYIEFVTDLPLFVAIEKGYFAKRGLDVDPVRAGDSNEALNLLLAGQADGVAHLAFSVFWTANEKSPGRFKVFLPCYETGDKSVSYLLVRNDSPINELSQLRGKKIATITGITQLVYLKLFLDDLKLDPTRDVTITQIAPNLQVQALQAGQFDALFTVDPYGAIALQNGAGKLLIANPRSKHIVDPFWAAAAAMSSQLLSKPEVAEKLYEGMAEAVDFMRADEAASKAVLPKYTPLDSSISTKVGLYQYAKIDELRDYAKLQDLANKMQQYGALDKIPDVKALFITKEELRLPATASAKRRHGWRLTL